MNGRLRIGVVSIGLAFVLAVVLGATGVLAPKSQRVALGASTTLTIISGTILVRHLAGDFAPAEDGAILGPGDTVRTRTDARGVLTYFEGSTVEIEPDSELTIDAAHANPDGSTVIIMKQDLGETWHVVSHLVQGGSTYEVHTSASTASVRGTQFTVGVTPDGTTTETTTEGTVATSDPQGAATVLTPGGQQTTTRKGEAPQAPQPAPEPERTVTVTVADPNALVIDPLGRANGVKGGKTIIQTPGARVTLVNGQIVVVLPDLPDGEVATHFTNPNPPDRDVAVSTKVEDKGKPPVEVIATVRPLSTAVTGVDVKKGAANEAPAVQLRKPANANPTSAAETPRPPTDEPKATDQPKKSGDAGTKSGDPNGLTGPTTNPGNTTDSNKNKDEKKTAAPTSGFIPPVNLPTIPVPVTDPSKKTGGPSGASGNGGPNSGGNTDAGGGGSSGNSGSGTGGSDNGAGHGNGNTGGTGSNDSGTNGSKDNGNGFKPDTKHLVPEPPAPRAPKK